jgi:hypothetical protein
MLDFVGIHFDKSGLRVQVTEFGASTKQILELNFGTFIFAQRSMDEGSFLTMSWDLDTSNHPIGPIVIVEGSDFIEWFHEQSCQLHRDKKIFHIAILTQNEWIEVLSKKSP